MADVVILAIGVRPELDLEVGSCSSDGHVNNPHPRVAPLKKPPPAETRCVQLWNRISQGPKEYPNVAATHRPPSGGERSTFREMPIFASRVPL